MIAIVVLALIGAIAGGTASGTNTDDGNPPVDSDSGTNTDDGNTPVDSDSGTNTDDGNPPVDSDTDQDIDAPGDDDATPSTEEVTIGDSVSNKAGIVFKVESAATLE